MVAVTTAITGSKTVNAAYIQKAVAKSLVIFKPKWPGLSFQEWFLPWIDSPSPHCHLCPRFPVKGERC
jgi:hypothetical protein